MKTLNWRHTDWNARNFVFLLGQEIIGQLTFHSHWNFNASYTDKETRLKFAQKGFWDRKVVITQDEKIIGEMDSGLFGRQTLKFANGEQYQLVSNFWGRDVNWRDSKGEVIISYEQATMSSMGKGTISLADSLTLDTAKLLISSGLFVRQLILKRVAVTIAILVPIIAASGR